ncbi:MAG: hypothetical protein KDD82_21375 [Planctomycetes bacterium]|nr:hypothetical protein [Planctomycetota bacterium]
MKTLTMVLLALLTGGVLGGVAAHATLSDTQEATERFDREALSAALNSLRLERDRLRREVDDAAKRQAELEAKLAEMAPAVDLGSSLEQAREQLAVLRDELLAARDRAEQALSEAQATVERLSGEAQAAAQRLVDQAQAEARTYAAQAQAAANNAVGAAQAEAERWRNEAQAARAEVTSLREDVKRLNQDVQTLNATIRELRTLRGALDNPFKR